MRGVASLLALAATGCSKLLGFDSATVIEPDGAIVDSAADSADGPPPDTMLAPITKTFRRGDDGYDGVRDTYIEAGGPNASNATENLLRVREPDRFALIAFDNIFGDNAIPPGAPIMAAHLELTCQNPGIVTMFLIAHPWDETVTFNTFGATAGVTLEDVGAQAATVPNTSGPLMIDVTSSVAEWSTDPSSNEGWLFLDTGGGGETAFQSSESSARPRLSVTYLAPVQ